MTSLSKETITKIRRLRRRGLSIPEISHEVNRPKSTIFRYIKGIKIHLSYRQRWLDRRNASKIISERSWREAYQKAEQSVTTLTQKELMLIGSSLYWAEGAKRDFSISNTDPGLVKVFLHTLKNVFGVDKKDIKISLRIYEDLDKKECLRYWSKITGIKLGQKISVNILRGFKKGKLKYGMCRIRVKRGGLLHKEIFAIIRRINNLIPSP